MSKMPKQKPGRSKQDYQTPPEFLQTVKNLLDITYFDFDLAADKNNTVVHHALDDKGYFDEADNALVQCWRLGYGYNWCNPPYADIRPWVEHACIQTMTFYCKTAMLLPAGVGSNWWRDWVHNKAYVHFLNPRLQFVGTTASYPKDLALLLWSPATTGSGGYNVWTWRKNEASR